AGDRREDRRVLEVEPGLLQGGARLGHLRLRAGRLGAANRHLTPAAPGVPEPRLGRLALPARLRQRHLLTGQLGFGLRHLGARPVEASPGRFEGRAGHPERAVGVVELLTRNQLAAEQLLHPSAIEARSIEVRLAPAGTSSLSRASTSTTVPRTRALTGEMWASTNASSVEIWRSQ